MPALVIAAIFSLLSISQISYSKTSLKIAEQDFSMLNKQIIAQIVINKTVQAEFKRYDLVFNDCGAFKVNEFDQTNNTFKVSSKCLTDKIIVINGTYRAKNKPEGSIQVKNIRFFFAG